MKKVDFLVANFFDIDNYKDVFKKINNVLNENGYLVLYGLYGENGKKFFNYVLNCNYTLEEVITLDPFCVDYKTLILTDSGWKKIKNINKFEDKVASYNLKKNCIEFVDIKKLGGLFYRGTYFIIKNNFYSLVSTKVHKVVVLNGKNKNLYPSLLSVSRIKRLPYYRRILSTSIFYGIEENEDIDIIWILSKLLLYLKYSPGNKEITSKIKRNVSNLERLNNIKNRIGEGFEIHSFSDIDEEIYFSFFVESKSEFISKLISYLNLKRLVLSLNIKRLMFLNINDRKKLIKFILEEIKYKKEKIGDEYITHLDFSKCRRSSISIISTILFSLGYSCRYTSSSILVSKKQYFFIRPNEIKTSVSRKKFFIVISNENGTIICSRDGRIFITGNSSFTREKKKVLESVFILKKSSNSTSQTAGINHNQDYEDFPENYFSSKNFEVLKYIVSKYYKRNNLKSFLTLNFPKEEQEIVSLMVNNVIHVNLNK